jgi:hypothetical protein
MAALMIAAAAWLASSRLETKALQSQRTYLGFTSPTHILFRWSDSGCWHRAQDWSPLMLKLYAPIRDTRSVDIPTAPLPNLRRIDSALTIATRKEGLIPWHELIDGT